MLSIWLDSIELTWIDWSLWRRFKNEEGSCIIISQILTSGGLCRVGWKCCQFELIWSNWYESFPLLSIHHAWSRFTRTGTPCESSRVIKCLIRIDWSLLTRSKNEEGSCIIISWILTSGSAIDAMRIESNCKVPQTNQLSLGVLDMDGKQHYVKKLKRQLQVQNVVLEFFVMLKNYLQ